MFLAFLICQTANAETITISATTLASFSGNSTARYESFEEEMDGSNAEYSSITTSQYYPGTNSPYIFSQSGTMLVSPFPNRRENSGFSSKIGVIDVSEAMSYNFSDYGSMNSNHLPANGNRFIVQLATDSESALYFTLKLPYNVSAIGGYWFCSGVTVGSDKIVVKLYDENYSLLGTEYVIAAAVNDENWSNNYAAWEIQKNGEKCDLIRYISLGNYYTHSSSDPCRPGVDMLMFVPEPSSLIELSAALSLFIIIWAWRNNRQHCVA
jgi:hypothetical protein